MSKLEYLEPLKPLDVPNVLKSPTRKSSELFTPINVFGSGGCETPPVRSLVPEAPRLNVSNSKRMNPLYYKTRDMHTSYNSLVNKLYPGPETSDPKISGPGVQNPLVSKTFGPKTFGPVPGNPKTRSVLDRRSLKHPSPEILGPKVFEPSFKENSEDPINTEDPGPKVLGLTPGPGALKSKTPLRIHISNKVRDSLQNYLDNLEAVESYTECSLSVIPKKYELEETSESIEILDEPNLTKKKCMVWWEGETIPYVKFRQNPDNIIFIVGEDAYGYSKKDLYKEYIETIKNKMKDSKNLFFDLNLNWEDNETLWIPLTHILKVLEYSHPVYEIQKMKYSMHVWNLVPVKLK